MKTSNQLIAEFNEVRNSQKKITQFDSVSEFLKHGKDIAIKKANILIQMENLFK